MLASRTTSTDETDGHARAIVTAPLAEADEAEFQARVARGCDRLDEAELQFCKALSLRRAALGDDHPQTIQTMKECGAALHMDEGNPLQQAEVRIDHTTTFQPDGYAADQEPSSLPHLRLGIACMSKGAKPEDLEWWLNHHHLLIGVDHFFLRVEQPSIATRELLARPKWVNCVHTTFANDSCATARDCGGLQVARQDDHVQRSITIARHSGCTHLLHIDDDELLYLPSGRAAFYQHLHTAPPSAAELHVRNLEALAPTPECVQPFAEVHAYRHRPREYAGYGWLRGSTGKSIGVLRHRGLVPIGPHHFGKCEPAGLAVGRAGLVMGRARRSEATVGGTLAQETALLPPSVGVVLHYHCASFATWTAKFTDHIASLQQLLRRTGGRQLSHQSSDASEGCAGPGSDGSDGGGSDGCGGSTDGGGASGGKEKVGGGVGEEGRPRLAVHREIESLLHDCWHTELCNAKGGCEGESLAGLPSFHDASSAAAAALAAADEIGDDDTMAQATDSCRKLWARWRVQPAGAVLPSLGETESHRVLDNGITLIRPPLPGTWS